MTVFDPNDQRVISINFREVAPSLASTDMLHGTDGQVCAFATWHECIDM